VNKEKKLNTVEEIRDVIENLDAVKELKIFNCPCKKCSDAIKKGVKSMKEEGAPGFCIQDYVQEMLSGDWVECENCQDNDWGKKRD